MVKIKPEEIKVLSNYIYNVSGISIDASKAYLLETRFGKLLDEEGCSSYSEFYHKAKQFDLPVFSAGDADEIAEASAAMFAGRIEGFKIAAALGLGDEDLIDQSEARRVAELGRRLGDAPEEPGLQEVRGEPVGLGPGPLVPEATRVGHHGRIEGLGDIGGHGNTQFA